MIDHQESKGMTKLLLNGFKSKKKKKKKRKPFLSLKWFRIKKFKNKQIKKSTNTLLN